MKLTFLGTSAGEEYPGIWCDCYNCLKARKLGGKNIRRNSSVIIDDDVMIDIGKTAHIQAERFGKNIRSINTLLVTHSHNDHFNIHTLWARGKTPGVENMTSEEQKSTMSPRFTKLPDLDLFGNDQVEKIVINENILDNAGINFNLVEPYKKYNALNLEIITLGGNHQDRDGRSINYLLKRDGITFLYLLDTGWPLEETLNEIVKYKYDFIIVEGTFGLGIDSPYHMNLDKNIKLLEFFNRNNLWKYNPDYYLTHLSPHWCSPHDDYLPLVEEVGLKLAYDGLEIEYV